MKKYTILVTGYRYDFYDEEEIEILAKTDEDALRFARRATGLHWPNLKITNIQP